MQQQFINACKNGNLELAQQLFYNNNITLEINKLAFCLACYHGCLHVAQWLLSVNPDINISARNEEAFRWACLNGHLHVAQWLLSVKNDINISADNEYAFRCSCSKGYLKIAQWLLSIKPNINISVGNEYAFRFSCSEGHLDVAQWLLSIKHDIDISAGDDFAFRCACSQGHLHVAQWLQTLKPYLYIIHYNDNKTHQSYRIRTKEEEKRFIQKIYASWLASDITPNKNNMLYQLPQDISRLIISYI